MSEALKIVSYLLKQHINDNGQHIIYDDELKVIKTELERLEKERKEFIESNIEKSEILRIIKEKLDANTICRVFGYKGYEIIEYFTNDDLLKEELKWNVVFVV